MYVLSLKTNHMAVTHKPAFSSWTECKPTDKFFILSGLCFVVRDVYVCVRAQEGHLTDHSRVSEDKCCWWSAVVGSASGEDVHCSTKCIQTIFALIGSLTKPVSLWENCKSFISKAVAKGQIPTVSFWLQQEWTSMGERACYGLDKPESCPHSCSSRKAPDKCVLCFFLTLMLCSYSIPPSPMAWWERKQLSQRRNKEHSGAETVIFLHVYSWSAVPSPWAPGAHYNKVSLINLPKGWEEQTEVSGAYGWSRELLRAWEHYHPCWCP